MSVYYNECGQVAVLYSADYGVGWLTPNAELFRESEHGPELFKLMASDAGLVRMHLAGKTEQEMRVELAKLVRPYGIFVETAGEPYDPDTCGYFLCVMAWKNLAIEWVTEGSIISVSEYDGKERIAVSGNIHNGCQGVIGY